MAPGKAAALQSLSILVAAALGTTWTYCFHPRRPALYLAPAHREEPGIGFAEIEAWETPPVWIDARPPAAFQAGHIPEALSIPPDKIEAQIQAHFALFIDQRKQFVIYGPPAAADALLVRLRELGLRKVHRLGEDWRTWQAPQS